MWYKICTTHLLAGYGRVFAANHAAPVYVAGKAVWSVLHNMLVKVSIATILTAKLVDCVTSDTERKEYCG